MIGTEGYAEGYVIQTPDGQFIKRTTSLGHASDKVRYHRVPLKEATVFNPRTAHWAKKDMRKQKGFEGLMWVQAEERRLVVLIGSPEAMV